MVGCFPAFAAGTRRAYTARRGRWGRAATARGQRRIAMPAYVLLGKWTDQGVKNARNSVERADRFRAAVEATGGRLTAVYWTQGAYDIVATLEFPDEEAAMATLISLGSLGNVRTETLRAFSPDEMQRIVGRLPQP